MFVYHLIHNISVSNMTDLLRSPRRCLPILSGNVELFTVPLVRFGIAGIV